MSRARYGHAARRLGLVAAFGMACAGCFGEDEATFVGTVAEGRAGHSFDEWPNQDDLPPIEGAIVELCMDKCGKPLTDITDEHGRWGKLDTGVFGLGIGGGPMFRITVKADGYKGFEYTAQYGDVDHEEIDGLNFMNIRLARRRDDAGTGDVDAGLPNEQDAGR